MQQLQAPQHSALLCTHDSKRSFASDKLDGKATSYAKSSFFSMILCYPLVCGESPCFLLCVYIYIYIFFFWPHHVACRILVPQPGIQLVPPAVEVWSLNQWTATEVLPIFFNVFFFWYLWTSFTHFS